jgi:broad specificity phosphatase PhoE
MNKLIIIRHGETIENSQRICQGQTQGTLSEKGIGQAQRVGKYLQNKDISQIYTSPLKRAVDTANIVNGFLKIKIIKEDKRLIERFMGVLEGQLLPADYVAGQFIEGAETFQDIKTRLAEFLSELHSIHQDKTILLVTHSQTIAVLNAILASKDISFLTRNDFVNNTTITTAVTYNAVTHYILDSVDVDRLEKL